VQPEIKLIQDKDKFPLSITLGANYRPNSKLLLSIDTMKIEGRNQKIRFGTEYLPMKLFALRAGIDETEVTLGFGVNINNIEVGYAFGYHDALSGFSGLGTSHRFGINYSWDGAKPKLAGTEATNILPQTIEEK
jgi:hypothetical protein